MISLPGIQHNNGLLHIVLREGLCRVVVAADKGLDQVTLFMELPTREFRQIVTQIEVIEIVPVFLNPVALFFQNDFLTCRNTLHHSLIMEKPFK